VPAESKRAYITDEIDVSDVMQLSGDSLRKQKAPKTVAA
jgi:hypothetical protein